MASPLEMYSKIYPTNIFFSSFDINNVATWTTFSVIKSSYYNVGKQCIRMLFRGRAALEEERH